MSDKICCICAGFSGTQVSAIADLMVRATGRQQMAIARQFVLLGEIDKVVDARFVKSGKPGARIRVVGAAERVLAGQQAAGNDPIGVGQRSIHGQTGLVVRVGHRRMLPAIDSALLIPTQPSVDRHTAVISPQAWIRAGDAMVQYPGSLDRTDPYSAAAAVATDIRVAVIECEAVNR